MYLLYLLNKMKNHLIIGCSSGIGERLADILIRNGDTVYGTFNKNKPAAGIIAQRLDVLEDEFDPGSLPDELDSFVFCPGAIDLKPFSRVKKDDLLLDLNLQVVSAVDILQKVLPRLKASDHSSILFFSTVAVGTGFNFHSQVAISKGAIEGLTRSLAAELSPGIRVNAIAPSLTDTPLAEKLLNSDKKKEANAERHPLKRIGRVEDIAEMAAFMISDKASWITGQIIAVDGGMSSIHS